MRRGPFWSKSWRIVISKRRLAYLSKTGPVAALLGAKYRLNVVRYQQPNLGQDGAMRIAIVSDLHFGWGR